MSAEIMMPQNPSGTLSTGSPAPWVIGGAGAVRLLYGIGMVALLVSGAQRVDQFAGVALTSTAVEFVAHGIALIMCAGLLLRKENGLVIAVGAEFVVSLLGVSILIAGYNHFTMAGGLTELGAVAVAGISATALALAGALD
ncbi:hypothetical protein ACIRRA_28500 [Nocardia sp. NPDC101769]|uniref:hypothetical protein n=1 Tax=Nocardia sp. NPDC101769 TaxID=3364333 RepID=UPI0038070A07